MWMLGQQPKGHHEVRLPTPHRLSQLEDRLIGPPRQS